MYKKQQEMEILFLFIVGCFALKIFTHLYKTWPNGNYRTKKKPEISVSGF
jgi:hypothetical protein